jgi:hypothetical protein
MKLVQSLSVAVLCLVLASCNQTPQPEQTSTRVSPLLTASPATAFECSHNSNASSFTLQITRTLYNANRIYTVSVASPGSGISVSDPQFVAVGVPVTFKLETRRTPPGWYELAITAVSGRSLLEGTVQLQVIAAAEGAPGDCFTKLEGFSDEFVAVHAAPDGNVYASYRSFANPNTLQVGLIRRYAPSATTSSVMYMTPSIPNGASAIVRFGSITAGEVYATEVSQSSSNNISGRVLQLSPTGWTPVPLSLQTNEVPTFLVYWNNRIFVATASASAAISRLISLVSGQTLFTLPSGETILELRALGSRLFVATLNSNKNANKVYEWVNGGLLQRCAYVGGGSSLVSDFQDGLLIGTQNAVYRLAANAATCTIDPRTWAANHLLLDSSTGSLFAAILQYNTGDLLRDQGGAGVAVYPGQPIPGANQIIESDGRLWIASSNGLYRLTP